MKKNIRKNPNPPISMKGIVFENGKVWLRKNERQEWELPGGKPNAKEQPEETVAREIKEELGFDVEVISPVQIHLYSIKNSDKKPTQVFVASYLCKLLGKSGKFEHVGEAGKAEFRSFTREEIGSLNMPEFYKSAIEKALKISKIYK